MDFPVGARDEVLQVTPRLRLRREGGDFGEIRRRPLKEVVKFLQLLKRHPFVGGGLDTFEHPLQFLPLRLLVFDEALEIDDHSNCLCLMSMYCDTSWLHIRSFSSSEKRTPRCFKVFSNSRNLCQSRWPPRCRNKSSELLASAEENNGATPGGWIMPTITRCWRQMRFTLLTKLLASSGSSSEVSRMISARRRRRRRMKEHTSS